MKKNKKQVPPQYIVRVTTHKELRGKQKAPSEFEITKKPPRKEKFSYKASDNKKRLVRSKVVTSLIDEGNVRRTTSVVIFKRQSDVAAFLKREARKFKRSKEHDFSAIAQVAFGKVINVRRGRVAIGTEISKAARFYAVKQRKNIEQITSDINDFTREMDKVFQITSPILEYIEHPRKPRKQKGRKVRLRYHGEKYAPKRKKKFIPKKPSRVGKRIAQRLKKVRKKK